jgi:hypothetical protein
VGERLKPAVLKTVRLERVSGVRIPPPPPLNVALNLNRLSSFCLAKAFIPIYPDSNFCLSSGQRSAKPWHQRLGDYCKMRLVRFLD